MKYLSFHRNQNAFSHFQGSEIRLKYLNEDNGFSYGMTNCIFNYALHQVDYFETEINRNRHSVIRNYP